MASEYSCKFSAKAVVDIEDIMQYISETLCNKQAAKSLLRKIFDKIDQICTYPESGNTIENPFLSDKAVRKVNVDNYVLYYKAEAKEQVIYVIRIVYGKRNLDEILRLL